MTPVRSRRGRPSLPPERRAVVDIRLKLDPEVYERVCRIARRANKPVKVIARIMIERMSRTPDYPPVP